MDGILTITPPKLEGGRTKTIKVRHKQATDRDRRLEPGPMSPALPLYRFSGAQAATIFPISTWFSARSRLRPVWISAMWVNACG